MQASNPPPQTNATNISQSTWCHIPDSGIIIHTSVKTSDQDNQQKQCLFPMVHSTTAYQLLETATKDSQLIFLYIQTCGTFNLTCCQETSTNTFKKRSTGYETANMLTFTTMNLYRTATVNAKLAKLRKQNNIND